MLVLEVGFPVVTDDPVCVGCWIRLLFGTSYLTTEIVIWSLEKTFAQVHIADWVDALGELHRTWNLAVSVAPVMFNTLQMPLVD